MILPGVKGQGQSGSFRAQGDSPASPWSMQAEEHASSAQQIWRPGHSVWFPQPPVQTAGRIRPPGCFGHRSAGEGKTRLLRELYIGCRNGTNMPLKPLGKQTKPHGIDHFRTFLQCIPSKGRTSIP